MEHAMEGISYKVNDRGRLAQLSYPEGRMVTLVYDVSDRVEEIRDSQLGNLRLSYDILDRLVTVVYSGGLHISYAYDQSNNQKRITYPSGEEVLYDRNLNGWIIGINTDRGRIAYEYDAAGRLRLESLPNGIMSMYEYDKGGRLTHLTIRGRDASTLFEFMLSVDAVGNCTIVKQTWRGRDCTIRCKYDPLYRLVLVDGSIGTREKNQYDEIGNRTLKEEASSPLGREKRLLRRPMGRWRKTNYVYDAEGRLAKAGRSCFRYDEKGRLVEKENDGKTTRYSYDAVGNLVRISYHDGTQSAYGYDIFGRRTYRRFPNGEVISYLYDGYNVIEEIDANGIRRASYLHGPYVDYPVRMTRNGKDYYYIRDPLGSIIALADEEGEIVSEYEYDIWGNILLERGRVENPFRFTGREWDVESGLYYYRSRYYDSALGRFITPDPMPCSLHDPQTLNRYSYASNNPLSYVDPFGLSSRPRQLTPPQPPKPVFLRTQPGLQPAFGPTKPVFQKIQPPLKSILPPTQQTYPSFQQQFPTLRTPQPMRISSPTPSYAFPISSVQQPFSMSQIILSQGGPFNPQSNYQHLWGYLAKSLPGCVAKKHQPGLWIRCRKLRNRSYVCNLRAL